MLLKRVISFFLLVISFSVVRGQTHMLIGPASGIASVTGNYYSWSIGEVIVFNEAPSSGSGISMAQSMQSYISPPKVDNCLTVSLVNTSEQLCNSTTAFIRTLTYTVLPATLTELDTVQWYFAESVSANDKEYSKIIGATSTNVLFPYRPYFPGAYKVCLKKNSLNCKVCSAPIQVTLLSSSVSMPSISHDGQPAQTLSINYDTKPGDPTVQWYAYVPTLKKYLVIVGGIKASLNVRYDGDYMAIVSYPNGCKLTANTTVSGYNRPLYRATDVIIDGNTIYIPEETAYAHSSLKIYPNPAYTQFTVQYESSSEIISKAELFSNTGILVKEISFGEGSNWSKTAIVDVEDLSAGVYFLKVNEDNRQIVQKVVLTK